MSYADDDEIRGRDDQRFIPKEDHDAAREWFKRKARADDRHWTKEDQLKNLKRLRETFERLELPKVKR